MAAAPPSPALLRLAVRDQWNLKLSVRLCEIADKLRILNLISHRVATLSPNLAPQ